MNSFVSDFLYAFRILFKRPGLTVLAILALSVSLGMTTTAFSTLNGLFFKPLPFKNPETLHHIYLKGIEWEGKMMPIPSGQLAGLSDLDSFAEVMAYYAGTINISGEGKPERYTGAFVSPNFLGVLGHEPELGRSFSADSILPDGPREILISHEMWTTRFHSDPDVLDKRIRANGAEHRIVGVLPEGFHFPSDAHAWVPLNSSLFPGEEGQQMQVIAVGRLQADHTLESAREELTRHYASWEKGSVDEKDKLLLTCEPFGRLEMNNASLSMIIVMNGATIFILLVSCANVANLLVGRALTRGREMAIRSAIGATRARIIQQLLMESLVLSFAGAIGGLLIAAWWVDVTYESSLLQLPYWMNFELDWRVFGFVFVVMLGTALVSGLIPAWQASKIDLNEMLKDTSHTSTSFRLGKVTRVLAVIQIAFSCALLFGAGLIARNTIEMSRIDPGFAADRVLTMRMGLFPKDYPSEEDRDAFYAQLTEAVGKVPGVEDAAVSSWIGMYGNFEEPFLLADETAETPKLAYAYIEAVSPEYFGTLKMETLKGRTFMEEDGIDSSRVLVVNEAFTKRYLAGRSPIGETLSLFMNRMDSTRADPSETWQIVGVVSNVRVSNYTKPEKTEAIIYLPYRQVASPFMSLLLSSGTAGDPKLHEAIQEAIFMLDPHLPVYFRQTMGEFIDELIYPYKILANFFLSIGLMALFLAAIGVYGMLAFNVSRRRREIGIRMALGANTRNIVTRVLRQGVYQLVAGLVVGTGLAYIVGRLIRNFLFGVNAMDPSIYAGVLLTLTGVATLAFFLPARRASRLSPMDALRYE
jgi:putative ABC transport system permease protein